MTDGSELAKVHFCVMMEFLRQNDTDFAVVNYAEFASGYNATLNGIVQLEKASEVQPAAPKAEGIADDTFTCEATVCGPDTFVQGGILSQGDLVQICINSASYPEASISTGIESLTYTACSP